MKISESLTYAAIGTGALATASGLKTYVSFLGSSVAIPMQFGITGAPTWFMASPHAFLIYPLTTAAVTAGCYYLSESEPNSHWIHYPFAFHPDQQEVQHELVVNYTSSISLLTNSFMILLSARYIPQIVAGARAALPSSLVGGLLGGMALSSIAYFYEAYKHKERKYGRQD